MIGTDGEPDMHERITIINCKCGHPRTAHSIGANLPFESGTCHCGCVTYDAELARARRSGPSGRNLDA